MNIEVPKPKVGQLWIPAGAPANKGREVRKVEPRGEFYTVWWGPPGGSTRESGTWYSTWVGWVRKTQARCLKG